MQWTFLTQLDDLELSNDLACVFHSRTQMQDKTSKLKRLLAGTVLNLSKRKTELMRINTKVVTPIIVSAKPIKDAESFTCLGSNVDVQGGTDNRYFQDWKGESNFCPAEEDLGIKGDLHRYQTPDLQYYASLTVWM